MQHKSIRETSADLHAKKISSSELTKEFLSHIKKHDAELNSIITLTEESALEQAKKADEMLASKQAKPLTGIPILHKDIFCTKGIKTSCGSKMLDNFISPYDATVVTNLKEAGTVCLGKTNMDEFAMGSSNETSFYGPTRNPWNVEYVPGGSSGGSAAAIAARFALGSTSTDTGGSIRQPAAFCGVTGIKPTYGLVSRFGMIAFASSLDQGGPIAASAEDCAFLLEAMAGFDPKDSTSSEIQIPRYSENLDQDIAGLRIGIPKEFFVSLKSEMADAIDTSIRQLEKLGAIIKEISLPNTKLAIPAYYIIAPAECSSNLARYDGIRFGHRTQNAKDLNELYAKSRSEGFGDEVKRRILLGTYVLSAGYYDAYYVKAQKIRTLISQEFTKAFQEVDLIAGPTTPDTAFKLGSKQADPIAMYLNDLYTSSVNLAGLPAISLPAGFLNNLPVGMQLIGNYFEEQKLLSVAHQYQKQTDWHTRTCL